MCVCVLAFHAISIRIEWRIITLGNWMKYAWLHTRKRQEHVILFYKMLYINLWRAAVVAFFLYCLLKFISNYAKKINDKLNGFHLPNAVDWFVIVNAFFFVAVVIMSFPNDITIRTSITQSLALLSCVTCKMLSFFAKAVS